MSALRRPSIGPSGIGAKGNEGVAGNVAQTSGSIGYVEYAYAMQNHLAYTKLNNHDGQVVSRPWRASRQRPPTPTGTMPTIST